MGETGSPLSRRVRSLKTRLLPKKTGEPNKTDANLHIRPVVLLAIAYAIYRAPRSDNRCVFFADVSNGCAKRELLKFGQIGAKISLILPRCDSNGDTK